MTSYHVSTCGECLLSLSLFTLCLSVEHAGSLKRGQLKPGWNQTLRQTSNVPTSRAQSYGDSGRASPAQLFACLSTQLVITNHFQFFQSTPPSPSDGKLCVRPLELGARVIKIMTLTLQKRVAPCRGHRDVTVCHYFFFHHGLNIIARVLVRTHKRKIETSMNGRTQGCTLPRAKREKLMEQPSPYTTEDQ